VEHGLKVLTLYNTNKLSVHEIENLLTEKFDKYSKQTLEIADLTNSTFTITDLSKSGIHFFKPLINKNQAAILGISGVDFKTNSFNVSITFDHRVTEGKTIAAFLNSLKTNMEKYHKQGGNYVNRRQQAANLIKKLDSKIKEGDFNSVEILSVLKEMMEIFSTRL
jgi:pyruvate/2-oxoglutarate dehydrogenase complex dihydrolipoamide acyltransferase (E2) component